MSDIDDAIARGLRYPPRSAEFPDEDWEVWDDDPDEVPPASLPLAPEQLRSLADAIDRGLQERGCDNTLRAAQAWARRAKVPWRQLRSALEDNGGFCDCEVLLNVVEPPG